LEYKVSKSVYNSTFGRSDFQRYASLRGMPALKSFLPYMTVYYSDNLHFRASVYDSLDVNYIKEANGLKPIIRSILDQPQIDLDTAVRNQTDLSSFAASINWSTLSPKTLLDDLELAAPSHVRLKKLDFNKENGTKFTRCTFGNRFNQVLWGAEEGHDCRCDREGL
jgi:hypothetical protein